MGTKVYIDDQDLEESKSEVMNLNKSQVILETEEYSDDEKYDEIYKS